MFFWNSLAFLMMAIWSLALLPFLNPAWKSGSSWSKHCWNLAWRILSITLLACEVKWKSLSHVWLFATQRTGYSPGQNAGVGSLSLFQGIFPTQGLNSGLLHCRWILYQLSHKLSYKGSPRVLEWVAYPFSNGSYQPRNQTRGLLHCSQILYQLSYQGSPC